MSEERAFRNIIILKIYNVELDIGRSPLYYLPLVIVLLV